MQKRLVLALILCLACFGVRGQNLVPNGSFEELNPDSCRLSYDNFDNTIKYWFTARGTSDIFNVCDDTTDNYPFGVPNNFCGFQDAKDGNGYSGIITFGLGSFFYEPINPSYAYREWIGVKLSTILTENAIYCIEYYVNLSDTSVITIAPPQIFFSPYGFCTEGGQPNFNNYNTDHLAEFSKELVYDTINWTKISGEYVAKGDEEYIYIGNFYPYNNIKWDTIDMVPELNEQIMTYFYLDDISITKCGISEISHPPANLISIYPNPAADIVTVNTGALHNASVQLFDMQGRLLQQQNISNISTAIDVSGLASGVYVVSVLQNGVVVKRNKVVVSR